MRYTAGTADKFVLYQESVQSPDAEVDFIDRLYRKAYGERPTILREDFCGTALICCEWVKRRPTHRAIGVDLCRRTLDWGIRHNLGRLPPEAARRIRLLQRDVRHVVRPRVQVIGAFNYSYFVFKEAADLTAYFRAARRSLERRGLFLLDAYGGWESQQVMQERTRQKGFTYIWDQAAYNPINDHTLCHIHFEFPDGTRMRRAFTYDWRLWTLGTLQELLRSAGFSRTQVYWEGTNSRGRGDGVFRPRQSGENCSGWNAYVAAYP
jgi:hypothetical protein